jgi:superfamily II DNA or RNA helicase
MNRLTAYQADIVSECLEKGSGCLVVPMGTGKTVISLVLSQKLAGKGKNVNYRWKNVNSKLDN